MSRFTAPRAAGAKPIQPLPKPGIVRHSAPCQSPAAGSATAVKDSNPVSAKSSSNLKHRGQMARHSTPAPRQPLACVTNNSQVAKLDASKGLADHSVPTDGDSFTKKRKSPAAHAEAEAAADDDCEVVVTRKPRSSASAASSSKKAYVLDESDDDFAT